MITKVVEDILKTKFVCIPAVQEYAWSVWASIQRQDVTKPVLHVKVYDKRRIRLYHLVYS